MSWQDWDIVWGILPVVAWILLIYLRSLKAKVQTRRRTTKPAEPPKTPDRFEPDYEPIEPSIWGRTPRLAPPVRPDGKSPVPPK
jgi:hypothetical protein